MVVGAQRKPRFGLFSKNEVESSPESEGLLSRRRETNPDEALFGYERARKLAV